MSAWSRKGKERAASKNSHIERLSLRDVFDPAPKNPSVEVQELSQDARRTKRAFIPVDNPPSPIKRLRTTQSNTNAQVTDLEFGSAFEAFFGELYETEDIVQVAERSSEVIQVEERKARRRYMSSVCDNCIFRLHG
jgi:hypothetical protein